MCSRSIYRGALESQGQGCQGFGCLLKGTTKIIPFQLQLHNWYPCLCVGPELIILQVQTKSLQTELPLLLEKEKRQIGVETQR